MNRILVSF